MKSKPMSTLSTARTKAVDLGAMQNEIELATKQMKKATTDLQKANRAFAEAEERYVQANRTLITGVNALRASTKLAI